jgi:hypothetical protein
MIDYIIRVKEFGYNTDVPDDEIRRWALSKLQEVFADTAHAVRDEDRQSDYPEDE